MRAMISLAKVAALLASVSALLSASVEAQDRRQVTSTPHQLIAAFVRDYEGDGPLPSTAGMDLSAILLDRADYPGGSLNSVIEGLQEVALSQRSPRLRAVAIMYLASSGSRDALHPRPGTVARLERIYRQSNNALVRASVVTGLARSAEHHEALAFLEDVAARESQDFPGAPQAALTAIASHADEGTGLLRRLHQAKAVHDPQARLWLDQVATTGYRIR
jgi:hypothetical protein